MSARHGFRQRQKKSSINDLVVVDPHVDRPLAGSRRFARLRPLARRAPRVIAEGRERQEVRHREISYRRVLALADVLAGGVVLFGLVNVFPAAVFNPVMLVSLPFVVVVNKVSGSTSATSSC